MPASIKGRRVTDDAARNIAEAITAEFNWLANGDHPEPIRKAAGGHTLVAASRALAAVYSQITGTGPTTPPDALRQLATALDNAMAAYAQEQRRPRH
ncbi:MAG: hypothetical protein LRY54_04170 [Alphaproteobacteria bacterium]|nr:hypothetical protein [Alphaproteobacteria bacterium]